jgi:hypothetical protein
LDQVAEEESEKFKFRLQWDTRYIWV